jgi:hypothetical protein
MGNKSLNKTSHSLVESKRKQIQFPKLVLCCIQKPERWTKSRHAVILSGNSLLAYYTYYSQLEIAGFKNFAITLR